MLHMSVLALAEGGAFNPMDPAGMGGVLWTWIIFLVALPFMWKVVMGPITRALEARDDLVTGAMEKAERASQEAEQARAEIEVKLGEAQAQAAKLLSEARERAEEREREILGSAKQEAEHLVARARGEIETAREQALSAIRDEVVELSLSAASRVLERRVDSDDDRRLVSELVSATEGEAR